MTEAVLAINAGSSSIKLALFEVGADNALSLHASGQVDGIGDAPHFRAQDPQGETLAERRWPAGEARPHEDFLSCVLDFVDQALGADTLNLVGHRVVHGGAGHVEPEVVNDRLLADLDALTPLAPLHQPRSLAPIRGLAKLRPGLVQVACFDTAFHHTMPVLATQFALPRALTEAGVRRYGFHGLSYEYIASRLAVLAPDVAGGRVVAAHLGNGASLCAMVHGRSVDTTMGFTALDGLMMGTRCGTLDPGVVLYLLQQRGMTARAIEDLLYHKSGLLGVSGVSGDMRALVASTDPHAAFARELFAFRIARDTGALASTMGGIDAFVFTAGIGEHTPGIRAAVCERLAWLGVRLDAEANARGDFRVSAAGSRVPVLVVPTNEEVMIARHTVSVYCARNPVGA
jgi:acetate kinase